LKSRIQSNWGVEFGEKIVGGEEKYENETENMMTKWGPYLKPLAGKLINFFVFVFFPKEVCCLCCLKTTPPPSITLFYWIL